MKYKIWMINFGYYLERTFDTFEEATSHGKSTSFEFVVMQEKV